MRAFAIRSARALILGLGLVLGVGLLPAAQAAPPGASRVLDYVILKEGEPIGWEKVEIAPEGERTLVSVQASTRVKLLLLNFTYDHSRHEVWHGPTLESAAAETNDDGTPHKLELGRSPAGWRLSVDGATSELPPEALPLSLWTAAVVKSPLLIGVIDGQRYHVSARLVGAETIEAAGRSFKTQHWRLEGEVERDLWYGEDGTAVQIAFKRRGFDILYRLR